jgi:cell division septation protein DedD
VLIVVTGSLTSDEGVCRRFTQSFFLAPQESGGYFVLNDVFRFISERKPAEINQVVTQENGSSQNDRSASESCSALPEPTPADRSVISDHETTENIVTERQISNPPVNGTAVENNVHAEPPVQVVKEDLKKAPVAAPPPPAPTPTNVTKKSYASIVSYLSSIQFIGTDLQVP